MWAFTLAFEFRLEKPLGTPIVLERSTGRLSCQIDAKLPGGIERRWADEPDAALETRIPNILASFAVWAAVLKDQGSPSC
jgi:hypothetical protein